MSLDSPLTSRTARVTLKDLALHAGVSRSTVSLVLQNSDLVASATRERVQASMKTLGYVYNRSAASLRGAKSGTIGVLVHDIANPFFGALVAGIDASLQEAGYISFLASSHENLARQQQVLERMHEQHIDALLICPAENTPASLIKNLSHNAIPCIELMRHTGDLAQGDYIGANIREGIYNAVHHLAEHGHQRITLLAGSAQHSADAERVDGYISAMQALGLHDMIAIERGGLTRSAGLERTLELMNSETAPTALICYNDLVALGALLALSRLKLKAGIDCAVVGIDDIDESALVTPALTSIATHPYEVGKRAAQLALTRINDPQTPFQHLVLDAPLRIRATTHSCQEAL